MGTSTTHQDRMRLSYILLFAAAACAMAASDHMEKDTVVPEESVDENVFDVLTGVATTVGVEKRNINCGRGRKNYCAALGHGGAKKMACGRSCVSGYTDFRCNCCCMSNAEHSAAERKHKSSRSGRRRTKTHRHRRHRHSPWHGHMSSR